MLAQQISDGDRRCHQIDPAGAHFAPIHAARLLLLGDGGEIIAQCARPSRELHHRDAPGFFFDRRIAGRWFAVRLGDACEFFERVVEAKPGFLGGAIGEEARW